jgi:hypothetical protein
MKKLLLAAALSMVFVTSALAEDTRDQAYGKHDMGASPDSSMSKPNSASIGTQGMTTSKTRVVPKHPKQVNKQ